MLVADTGLLLSAVNSRAENFRSVRKVFLSLRASGYKFVTFPQNMTEFWAVATRPLENNGYGLSKENALSQVRVLEALGTIQPEHKDGYQEWRRLVEKYDVRGKTTHDAKIVAQMIACGYKTLITLNKKDFLRYVEIDAFTPSEALKLTHEKSLMPEPRLKP